MTRKLADDCFISDRPRLTHAEAIAILQARVTTVAEPEQVALVDATGRILAAPATTHIPVPNHTNAAVDGYCFAAADYDRDMGSTFTVTARIAAGHALAAIPTTGPTTGSAARIFTGAVMPAGHDTCAMQEDCTIAERDGVAAVTVPAGLKAGANVRKAGEDVAAGTDLMRHGRRHPPAGSCRARLHRYGACVGVQALARRHAVVGR